MINQLSLKPFDFDYIISKNDNFVPINIGMKH